MIAAALPSQAGRLAVITGGSAGLGFATALGLAEAGASVVIASRDPERGEAAVQRIRQAAASPHVWFESLDLGSLDSIAGFAARRAAAAPALDLLVNNAGVMALPERQLTADGFEMQFGVNFLGHFALTARLLPLLRQGQEPRIVSVGSLAHRLGRLDFGNLQGERRYRPWAVYAQSKLAVLSFATEFARRAARGGWGVGSVAAHPGWALTDLYANGPLSGGRKGLLVRLMQAATRSLSHSAEVGAQPILHAATASGLRPGAYVGRAWLFELRGGPAPARLAPAARDPWAAGRLWSVAEACTGLAFPPG